MPSAPDRDAPRRALVATLVGLVCLVWGSTWWGIRVCLEGQPPLLSVSMRFWIAGAVMVLLCPPLRRIEKAPPPPRWLWIAAGGTNFAASYGIIYVAEQHVTSGIAAVLWSIFPLLMATSAVLFLGERLLARQVAGFAVSFVGIVVVSSGDLGGGADLDSALLLLVSPFVSATGTTLVKKFGSGTSSVLLNRNAMLLGAALLGIAGLISEDVTKITWTTNGVLALVYLALFGTAFTFGVYFWLLRTAPASLMALISYVTPILAMMLSALVGDGTLELRDWAGAGLAATGVALVVVRGRR